MEKPEIRRMIRQRKAILDPERKARAAERLISQLLNSDIYLHARCILLYASLPDEVPTLRLLEQEYPRHHFVLPCVTGPTTMELRAYTHPSHLTTGAFNIPEPTGPLFTRLQDIGLAIIPGMAFDRQGNRLGRGKGYYDRFLALPQMQQVPTWGVCYDFQLLEHLPAAPHDRPVQRVILC